MSEQPITSDASKSYGNLLAVSIIINIVIVVAWWLTATFAIGYGDAGERASHRNLVFRVYAIAWGSANQCKEDHASALVEKGIYTDWVLNEKRQIDDWTLCRFTHDQYSELHIWLRGPTDTPVEEETLLGFSWPPTQYQGKMVYGGIWLIYSDGPMFVGESNPQEWVPVMEMFLPHLPSQIKLPE